MAVAAYTSRPRTTEAVGAVRRMPCDQGHAVCNRLAAARHSQLEPCDGAEIARIEVPDWLAAEPELLALSHAMLEQRGLPTPGAGKAFSKRRPWV